MGDVVGLVAGQTEKDLAEAFRNELRIVLGQACDIMDRARADGLTINWSVTVDAHGRHRVPDIQIVKPL